MTRVMISAFDDRLADYGFRMYRSFQRFNPDINCFFANFGTMSRTAELAQMGVRVIPKPAIVPEKRPNFYDALLWPFVEQVEWDKLLWVDADTLICRPLDPIWQYEVDFVGHPDRLKSGLVLTCDYDGQKCACTDGLRMAKFATGIWVTRNVDLLKEVWTRMKRNGHGLRDSDLFTAVVHAGGFSYAQLNGTLWNFSRDIVPLAQYDGEHIYYRERGRTYHPYAVGFSRVPIKGKDQRLTSPAIDQFYKERIENV